MEAPWISACSRLTKVTFEQQPPRLVRWGFHATSLQYLMIGVTDDGVLCRIEFAKNRQPAAIMAAWQKAWPRTEFAKDQKATGDLVANLLGKKKGAGIALRMIGTPFQLKVWKELLKVPPGETVSYADLARKIKKPKAMRAIGNAMGANPVPILVPCHRVIASSGKLGGFGGGLGLKRQLLEAEGVAA
ncbi:MAG TPA: methylated-DNA--[protein]-cysteine S-methyltransferase [Alphaproteobacteria bacterium]|jgi:O-6-methylguanine DNA methyltransferase|nr:methylated-DNA--[protein]-cysteine S-methyltransferase [Alphaproteobacteria bacterium]